MTAPATLPSPAFARALLRWYDREQRDLPWRRETGPYRSLVSEFMLQQTVVATVIPYFERFLARFPDFPALARAPEEEVLALWSGLGYYARARNLHRAARAVVEAHGGRLPPDEAGLRALPGVGEYTAAVLAAIVLGARTFALDGNAARVMARLWGEGRAIDRPEVKASLRARGQELVPVRRPGDFAQAVMELGATVCTPAPRCERCPVARFCQARAEGRAAELPTRTPRRARQLVRISCVAVERRGRVLLVRRPPGVLLAGTWALPSADEVPGDSDSAACGRALAGVGLSPAGAVSIAGEVRHVFTHRDLFARVFRARAGGAARGEVRWVSANELEELPVSSFTRKTLLALSRQ
jgi:A/G-specific adenine glycosylase